MSSNIYLTREAPRYPTGHGVVLGYLVLFVVIGSFLTHLLLDIENKKRRAGRRDHWVEGKSNSEIALMGDMR